METKRLSTSNEDIKTAGEILRLGGLVGIPTETVYGLAANALDSTAVEKIFVAKGRPQDNPLIVHISEISEVSPLVASFPQEARRLAERFWPGPLTIILPKSDIIPNVVSAGLNSVAIRLPESKAARRIIKAAGSPLAAPSANLSGSPSPTSYAHVLNDLDGKIDAVVEGEDSRVGVESTVISFVCNPPRILRPGGITPEMIREILPETEIDEAVLEELKNDTPVASPGMKYKHYSPKARIILVESDKDNFVKFIKKQREKDKNIFALVFLEDAPFLEKPYLTYGSENDDLSQAEQIFNVLRRLDQEGCNICYAHAPKKSGVGLAVYNRLIRAAAFEVIKL